MSKISKKNQNKISISIVIIGIVLAFIIFGPKNGDEKEAQAEQSFATRVGVMVLGEEGSKEAGVSKTAIFESKDTADAVAEQAGRIVSVNFNVGDQVQKGQILATFDQSNLVNSAKTALEDSLANLALAEDNLKKTRKSVDESLEIAKNNKHIDELELEQAETSGVQDDIDLAEKNLDNSKDAEDKAEEDAKISINNAKILVSQAQATARQNKIAYEKSIVRAPISGVITSRDVDRYDYISAGSGIAEISGASQLKAKIFLSGFEMSRVSKEDEVTIEIEEEKYPGKIVSLATVANSNNNRFEAQVESLKDISSKANQVAKIKINLKLSPEETNVFFVPLSAVSIGQQKNTVFVETDGKAKVVSVELGRTVGNQVEIIEGLKENDRLIVENNRGLREDEEVEVN